MTLSKIPINTYIASGVAISIIDGVPKLLLLKRVKGDFWCHVCGKIEGDETAWQTIIREFHEETGIVVNELYTAEFMERFYESEKNSITICPAFVVKCSPGEEIRLNEEHTEYRWCSVEEAKALVPFPNQKNLYDHIQQYFIDAEPSELMKIDVSL